jgi:hypothetical protein
VRITVCVTVEIPTTSLSGIERACIGHGRKGDDEAGYCPSLDRLEPSWEPRARRARRCQRRTILTQAGYITITRGKARPARWDPGLPQPTSGWICLPPHQASPAVRRRGRRACAEHPYPHPAPWAIRLPPPREHSRDCPWVSRASPGGLSCGTPPSPA